MSAILLRRGDTLPAVGVLQIMLNRTGARLALDGIFGRMTETAVRTFQAERRMPGTGMADQATWRRLAAGELLPVVDSVDVTDPDLFHTEVRDLSAAGATIVMRGGMCNGVAQAVADISRASAHGIFLLRMHGHGRAGLMRVSGHGDALENRSALDASNVRELARDLAPLRSAFGVYGSVELFGCKVAQGARGRSLLRQLADLWSVPVTAGTATQYAGGETTFRFEGPTVTACPRGQMLRQWVRSRPVPAGFTPM